jgi:polyketide synthase PksN
LKGLFSKELHMDVSRIEDATPFPDYGLDSVLLAQVLRQMSDQVGAVLDPSLLLEHSTIDGLTQWFLKHHRAALATLHMDFARPAADTAKTPGDPIVQPSRNVAPEATQGVPLSVLSRDIAVIGLSCRFPGAPTLEAFWQLLCDGRSAIGSVPRERWGTVVSFPAALLEDVTRFDPAHFHISDEDARAMDPQAFLLLEESLKALHHAGYTTKELKKLPVGVYIGARSQRVADEASLKAAPNPIRAAGPNYLAAGISQFFDLRGPSLVVDSACSSALVAMNMAVQALQLGEITSAFVGGVGLLADDKAHRLFEQRGILAKETAFHLFDQRASGVVLGEGSGMVILKLLDHAIRDGDRIYSVIKGLAINNDGRSAGPATPNLEAQVAVMRAGLAKSGRKPEEVQYIEVNGSGSEVTDLLELKALQAVYRDSNATPCALGSIKPNIGHPLCAEGIAGFIKAALMVWKGRHVPFLSGQVPMTHFDLTTSPFYFSRGTTEWAGKSRLAAVNCFADGGTNAHVILESWEQGSQMPSRAPLPPPEWHRKEVFVPAPAGLSAAGAPGSVKSSGNGNGNGNGHHGNGNGSGNGYGNGHHGKGDGMGNGKAQQHTPTSTKAAPVMAAGNRWRRSY